MRAAALLGVFILAKGLVVPGRVLFASPGSLLSHLWQDALAALIFGVVEIAWGRPRPPSGGAGGGELRAPRGRCAGAALGCLYGALVLYTALNVPIALVLSTPLTLPMLRATGGALAGSIAHHATAENIGACLLVLAAGALLPLLTRRIGRRALIAGGIAAVPFILLGGRAPWSVPPAGGLHRNALVALIETARPRVPAREAGGAGSSTDFIPEAFLEDGPAEDLSPYRGMAEGRSILLVMLESAGAARLEPYGAAADPMPNVTRLAADSIVFENAYAAYPESIKGLFSVLFSTYPAIDTPAAVHGSSAPASLAELLSRAGYATGLFHSGRFGYLGMDSIVRGRGFEALEDAGDIGGERDSSFGVDEESTVRRILGWLDGIPPGKKFFITYLPIAGHHPYETPEAGPFPEAEERGRYLNALHYADRALGILLRGLASRGRLESTLLVLAGDHGEAFHEHEGNYGHTLQIYEENVRVPLIIAGPGLLRGQVRASRTASLVDLAPTVLDLAALSPPPEWEGRSLLRGGRSRPALFLTDYSAALVGLRDGPWKFIHEIGSGRSSLFLLPADPGEREDLAARFPERVEAYRRGLVDWAASQRARVASPSPGHR